MASAGFLASLPFVLRWEGGFVDHPKDPGGRTNKGVTQRVYDAWRRRQGLPVRDVKGLEDTELHRIYEAGYWLPPRCDRLARRLDLVHFDTAVNMGPGRAVRFLQKAAGCGVDTSFYRNDWHDVAPLCEVVLCEFEEAQAYREAHPPKSTTARAVRSQHAAAHDDGRQAALFA